VSARATTGNLGGTGNYSLTLQGANGTLAPPAAVTPAALARGPNDPGAQQFSSPVVRMPLLQLRLIAPSHEELWVDGLTLRATGTGDDREDVADVRLVHDRDGDGSPDGDPVLASGVFLLDDGTLTLGNLGLVFDPGSVTDLLVVYDVTVTSVSSTTEAGLGHGWPWLLLLLLLVPLRRVRRRGFAVLALLALALAPLACGGGGGGANGPFDPTGVSVTFQVTLDENGIDATTPTLGPAGPLQLPTADIASSTLMVSN
jgi:MYXO-CTERM domain-containing protein